jgi:hypothetical protein
MLHHEGDLFGALFRWFGFAHNREVLGFLMSIVGVLLLSCIASVNLAVLVVSSLEIDRVLDFR